MWVSGVVFYQGRVAVHLTDGRVFTDADRLIERIDRRGAVIDDQRIFMKPIGSGRQPQPEQAQPAVSEIEQPPARPPSDDGSSWRLDADGVQRLKTTETFADLVRH